MNFCVASSAMKPLYTAVDPEECVCIPERMCFTLTQGEAMPDTDP